MKLLIGPDMAYNYFGGGYLNHHKRNQPWIPVDGSPGGKVDLKIFHKWLLYLMCSQASRSCGLLKKNLHIITKKVTFSGLSKKYGGMLFFVTLKTANWQTADCLNFSNIIKTITTSNLNFL